MERTLELDRLYVTHRGYQKWNLFNSIVAKRSSYLCRVSDRIKHEVIESKQLTQADIDAGGISDQTIRIVSSNSKLNHPIRLVIVQGTPHTSRGRKAGRKYPLTGPSSDGLIRLVTDMLDVPAEQIAQIYHLRWADRTIFQNVQAALRLSSSAEHQTRRGRNSNLQREHRLHVDLVVHQSFTD